jgi:hypothetical protein
MQIIENTNCVEQFRFPKSRKKRIRAKWAKRTENFRPSRRALQLGDKLICHPILARRLRAEIEVADSMRQAPTW